MKKLPNWNISKDSAQRLAGLLDKAAGVGIDPDAVIDAGLPAWRTLTALLQAADSPEGLKRDHLLDRAQDALQALDASRNGSLLQQFQARLLALRGRNGDDEIAHVTDGELVVPKSLQTPAVMSVLQKAAGDARVPFERLRIGSGINAVNPATNIPEFADPLTSPIEEITVTASREGFRPQAGDVDLLTRMIFAEGADHYRRNPEIFGALGWSAFNRVGAPGFAKGGLDDVIRQKNQFYSLTEKHADGRPSMWELSGKPDQLTGPNKVAYEAAHEAAARLLSGQLSDPTSGAQFFHSAPQTPPHFQDMLNRKMIEPVGPQIGQFKFFRSTRR